MSDNILFGPIPPPYHGQSVGFQMLIEGFKKQELPYHVINFNSKKRNRINGTFSCIRAFEYLRILFEYFYKVSGSKKNIYITIAGSRVGFYRDLLLIFWARFCRHRIVVHLKGGNYDDFYAAQPWLIKWLIRVTLRQTDAILVLGEKLRNMYDFEPKLKDKIHVVPNGLPFEPKRLPKSGKNIEEEPVRILYLSNLIESKGYFDVLEAVKILVKDYGLQVKCRFCGLFMQNVADDLRVKSPEQAKKLFMDFIDEYNLYDSVKYVGVVSGEKKQEELRKAHFFVLPTNYNIEGQPISIIEAMAYGCVLISTRYRAIPDMLIEERNGVFVEYGKPQQIAHAIIDISQNLDRFRQMSQFSIEHYKRNFTREAHLKKIIPLIIGES